MTRSPRLFREHRTFFIATVPLLVALAIVLKPSPEWQVIALAPLVAILGLPHGALDHRIANALWPLSNVLRNLIFGIAYIGVAGAVVMLWIVQPRIALIAFLAYSAFHFADDWRDDLGLWQSLPLGISTIALPAIAFQSEVARLFAFLTDAFTANAISEILHYCGIAVLGISLVCVSLNFQRKSWIFVEYIVLAMTALLVSPLLYFIIYFCGLHSPRHFLLTAEQLGMTPVQGLRATVPVTAATLLIVGLGASVLATFAPTFEAGTLQTVFIGLAALTVPHMILTGWFNSVHRRL